MSLRSTHRRHRADQLTQLAAAALILGCLANLTWHSLTLAPAAAPAAAMPINLDSGGSSTSTDNPHVLALPAHARTAVAPTPETPPLH